MSKKFTLIALLSAVITGAFGTFSGAKASPYYSEFGVCCSEKVEVPITPFALVAGAYQGQFEDQGIPGFATFNSKVDQGKITAKDLVKAAYFDYRATYSDLVGETDMIDKVDQYLKGYQMGRN